MSTLAGDVSSFRRGAWVGAGVAVGAGAVAGRDGGGAEVLAGSGEWGAADGGEFAVPGVDPGVWELAAPRAAGASADFGAPIDADNHAIKALCYWLYDRFGAVRPRGPRRSIPWRIAYGMRCTATLRHYATKADVANLKVWIVGLLLVVVLNVVGTAGAIVAVL